VRLFAAGAGALTGSRARRNFAGMPWLLRLFVAVATVLALVAGPMPPGAIADAAIVQNVIAPSSGQSDAPCTDKSACRDYCGCAANPAASNSPSPLVVRRLMPPKYHLAATSLSGISIEPELAPPIVAR
jgi:hypothetical protein